MMKHRCKSLGGALLAFAVLAVSLSTGAPPDKEKKAAATGVKPKAMEYLYNSANGQRLLAYPSDPINPYRQKEWRVETPLTVTSFKFDEKTGERAEGDRQRYQPRRTPRRP